MARTVTLRPLASDNIRLWKYQAGAVLRWGKGAPQTWALPPKPEPCPPQIFAYSNSKTSKQLYRERFWRVQGWSGWYGSFGLCFKGDD